jgi:diguanylate cyclase (GGDEF)-like protein
MRNKIILRLVSLMLFFGFVMVLLQTYNQREDGIDNGINKANAIAEVVQSGLTAHMVNGNMNERDIFLKSISQMESVKNLWIIRGENVIKQYGKSFDTVAPKDQMDKDVLSKGEFKYQLDDSVSNAILRVTIPYKATDSSTINCLQCHDVKYGDTLGAVSVVLDITDFKEDGILNVIIILVMTIIAIVVIAILVNKLLKPYIETLETIKSKIDYASTNGVFEKIDSDKILHTRETDEFVNKYNELADSLMLTFTQIDNKLRSFVGKTSSDKVTNPLRESNEIVTNLFHIYQFKKEIQLDKSKEETYNRIGQIFLNKFNIKNINIVEINENIRATKVYSHGNLDFCTNIILSNPDNCRVSRNANHICSIDYHQSCPHFSSDEHLYFCMDIEIGKSSKLIFNFIFNTQDELLEFQTNQSFIEKYIEEVAPEIEVKILLEALENSALRDGLTGLYNRRFFDENIKKLVPQAQREGLNIGVLMLDMDHFKAVNDEYGHDIGDKVLKEFARIVKENVREADIVVRFGGEEFLVLLVGVTSEQAAMDVANKLREKVADNVIDVYAGATMQKTISSGLSMFPGDSTSFTTVLKYADIALYEAKQGGRNQVKRYLPNTNDELELF